MENHEPRQAWETMKIMKGRKVGRQGGKAAAAVAAKSRPEWRSRMEIQGREGFWGSANQSLRSKNPYSFQLSGEKSMLLSGCSREEPAVASISAPNHKG